MSTSWIIESEDKQHSISGTCCIEEEGADAYRELLGIYTILNAIYFIEQSTNQPIKGRIKIGCDNEQAGYKSMMDDTKVSITHKHMDILKAIRRMRKTIETSTTSYHIYGHQDKHTPYHKLSREVQLNIQMDEIAQRILIETFENKGFVSQPVFPKEGYQLWLKSMKIHSHYRTHLRRHIGSKNLQQYLYDKQIVAWNIYPLLDWDVLRSFMNNQTQEFRLWYAKHWTNFCGIGKMMKRMKLWNTDLCPCCRQVPESSTTHLYVCPHPLIASKSEKAFKDILGWMEKVHTDPDIVYLVTDLWYGKHHQFTSDDPRYLIDISNIIRDIGVQSMWMGLIPAIMCKVQNDYYRSMGIRQTGKNGEWN